MPIDQSQIVKLRSQTGIGMMDCKRALEKTQGDFDKALKELKKQGKVKAAKKQEREAREGLIGSYIHSNQKVVALVELNCETDFVARNEDFKQLAHDLAMQVAATNPQYLAPDDVPEEVKEEEKEIFKTQLKKEGKPKKVIEKIIEGKLAKFYEEVCLLKQTYIKDDKKKVEEIITEKVAKIGENIQVGKFVRFSL